MPTTEELERAQEVLFNQGILMHLYVGRWTANKKLRSRDILAEGLHPDLIHLGHKKLLPKDAQQELRTIERMARSFVDAHSLDFPIGKAKYVYYRALPTVTARLRLFKEEWDRAVEGLIDGYPEYQRQQLERLDAQALEIANAELQKITDPQRRRQRAEELEKWKEDQKRINRELYPNVDMLRNLFAFEWRLFRVSAMDGVNQMNLLQQQDLEEAQQSVRADFRNWVRQASLELHRELGEAAAQAQRILEANGRISARSLRPLFEAFETFQSVSFSEGSEFQQAINRIRQRYASADLGVAAETVNSSPQEFQNLLSTMSGLAVTQVAEEAGIRAVRAGAFARLLDV